jgi:hypothetical protein
MTHRAMVSAIDQDQLQIAITISQFAIKIKKNRRGLWGNAQESRVSRFIYDT